MIPLQSKLEHRILIFFHFKTFQISTVSAGWQLCTKEHWHTEQFVNLPWGLLDIVLSSHPRSACAHWISPAFAHATGRCCCSASFQLARMTHSQREMQVCLGSISVVSPVERSLWFPLWWCILLAPSASQCWVVWWAPSLQWLHTRHTTCMGIMVGYNLLFNGHRQYFQVRFIDEVPLSFF